MAFSPSPLSFFRSGYELLNSPDRIALNIAQDDPTTGGNHGVAVDGDSLGFSTTVGTSIVHVATGSATPSKIEVNDRVYVTTAQGGAAEGGLAANTAYWVVYSYFLGTTLGHDLKLSLTRGGAPVTMTATSTASTGNPLRLLGPLNEITTDMADPASGDWRQVVAGIMEGLYQKWANLETTDRPTKLSISKSSGVSGTSSILTYTVRVTLMSQGVDDLAPE
jgi:hypothetical protein